MPENSIVSNPDTTINLVPMIMKIEDGMPSYYSSETKSGVEFLREIGQVCIEEFDKDLASRQTWERNVSNQLKMFTGYTEPKSNPWPDCSNVILPFITVAAIQFHARVYESLLPPKNIVQVARTGQEDEKKASRVEKYMNYQLMYEMVNFEEDMDKALMQIPIAGSVFKKTFYNPIKECIESTYIPSSDIVINYGCKNIETAPRISHVLYYTRNDIRKRVNRGIFIQDAWDLPISSATTLGTGRLTSEITRTADNIQGISGDGLSYFDNTSTRVLIEMHRELDINGDGIAEPVIVTIDYETQKILRIVDRAYQLEPGIDLIAEYFTYYQFLPNPEGFYGLGLGSLLIGLNDAANTIVNEVIDAGALANLQGGFISKRSGLKKGDLTFSMGEYKEVDIYLDDIKKAIMNLDFKGPNSTLYQVLGMLYDYSKLVSSVSETMTGALPASDTPAATVLALIEEGRKVFSSIHRRIHRSFKKELKKIFNLNRIYLNEARYLAILGDISYLLDPTVGINDFNSYIDVQPVSDPAIISKAEKIIKAEQVKNEILQNPSTASNSSAIEIATRNYLETLDVPNVDQFFIKTPPQDLDPFTENSNIIKEVPPTVLPSQDHMKHLQIHNDLIIGAFASQLTPPAKHLLDKHIQEHQGELYLIQNQSRMEAYGSNSPMPMSIQPTEMGSTMKGGA